MRVLRTAAVLVVLTGPAYAQMQTPSINLIPDAPTKSPEQIEQEQARDKAYKESLKAIPDAKTSSDPWGNVRSDAPKSATPKAKTATTTPKAKPATTPATTSTTSAATAAKTTTDKTKTGSNAPN